MTLTRWIRITAGTLLWCGAVAGFVWFLGVADGRGSETASATLSYFSTRDALYTVKLPRQVRIDVGTVVVERDWSSADGELSVETPTIPAGHRFVGEVAALLDADGKPQPYLYGTARAVTMRLFDGSQPLKHDARIRVIEVPQTFRWVVQTLFTDDATVRLAEEWNRTMYRHRDEFFALLTPVARKLAADLEALLTAELPLFLERHEAETRQLMSKVEREFAGENLLALFQQEIWPTVEAKLGPVLERIGGEIWKKVPLWGFSWRFAYERLPLTNDDHFRKAWDDFVDEHVVPTIQTHSHEVLDSIRSVSADALKNPRITGHLRASFRAVFADPAFQQLAQEFLKESVLDNPRFHALVRKQWNSPHVVLAVNKAGSYLEPMIRRMGDHILGTRTDGITKKFARVLRAQVLLKDHHRIVISRGSADAPSLAPESSIEATLEWESSR
jgi:hypothetical protein